MSNYFRFKLLKQTKDALTNSIRKRLVSNTPKKQSESIMADKVKVKEQEWVSYGFDETSKVNDRNITHVTFFFAISLILCGGTFCWSYLPDFMQRDWTQREAFLEIRRREKLGLPHIDCNYIDPSSIILPSDEELGDTEIEI